MHIWIYTYYAKYVWRNFNFVFGKINIKFILFEKCLRISVLHVPKIRTSQLKQNVRRMRMRCGSGEVSVCVCAPSNVVVAVPCLSLLHLSLCVINIYEFRLKKNRQSAFNFHFKRNMRAIGVRGPRAPPHSFKRAHLLCVYSYHYSELTIYTITLFAWIERQRLLDHIAHWFNFWLDWLYARARTRMCLCMCDCSRNAESTETERIRRRKCAYTAHTRHTPNSAKIVRRDIRKHKQYILYTIYSITWQHTLRQITFRWADFWTTAVCCSAV